jgi:hypothetical protein
MPKYCIHLYESVYIERVIDAADAVEAKEILYRSELPSVMEAWRRGEVETDVHGWEVYAVEELEDAKAAAA